MNKAELPPDESVRLLKLAFVIDQFREVDSAFPVSYIAALLAVAREPGLTGSEYAARLGLDQPVMSRILLEIGQKSRHGGPGRGWVLGVHDEIDLRRKNIYLTPVGRALVDVILDALR